MLANNESEIPSYSVSELNQRAKELLEVHLSRILVDGEISNFTQPSSGHWYFTLKDDKAQIKCAMFKNRNSLCRIKPKSGDQVVVRARVSLYEARGDYQLIVDHLKPAGAGSLQAQFEQLKAKLNSEGLFETSHKLEIPSNPKHVAVISSATGAALRDILHVMARRNPSVEITVIPAAVQGAESPAQLIRALELAQKENRFDLILLSRGGGSIEDLWAFNNELLAREIYRCEIPIISAVGHEIDFTIADFVADLRAPTPSAAAEIASPDLNIHIEKTHRLRSVLGDAFSNIIGKFENTIALRKAQLKSPQDTIEQWSQRLDSVELNLSKALQSSLKQKSSECVNLLNRYRRQTPLDNISRQNTNIYAFFIRLQKSTKNILEIKNLHLQHQSETLNTVSPLATLNRGYSIVKDKHGKLIKSKKVAATQKNIAIQFHDGEIGATIKN